MAKPDRNERLTAALRLVVATAALAIFLADPSEHPLRRPFASGVFALFAGYAAVSYLAARLGRAMRGSLLPWIDVGWITLAVAASQATSEIFYPLYLFAVVVASFSGGFRRGLAASVASAVAFATVGALTAPAGTDLRIFLVRPLYLLVLGYLIAVWGGYEVRSRARLALLRDVGALSNPRFGVEPTIGRVLEKVRAFFAADSCRAVVADELSGARWTMAAQRGHAPESEATSLPPEVADALLPPPADADFVVHAGLGGRTEFALHGPSATTEGDGRIGSALLTALDAGALVAVPFRFHASAAGRVYVARAAGNAFDREDAEFLRQVVDQVVPTLDNLRLVDHLASDAATEERRRIALDLHDSVIQPYLGLRLGLSAAHADLAAGRTEEAAAHVGRLVELAETEIQTLRGYVRALRSGEAGEQAALDASVRRFCRRFSDATGIRVDVATAAAPVSDRVAAAVFQMVAEALSNVRRHTAAARADVHIETEDGKLRLTVANDGAPADAVAFFPRSLAERASALGGRLSVQHPTPGTTAVRVEVPL